MFAYAKLGVLMIFALMASFELSCVSPVLAENFKEIPKWTWNDIDGEIFGNDDYFPNVKGGNSNPRGILKVPGLHRDDVELFSLCRGFTILRVKSTGKCCLLAHWTTRGEDNSYGVYAVDFEKGGSRFITVGEEATKFPRGIRYVNHFPSLEFLRLELELGQELDDEEAQTLESLTTLSVLDLYGPAINHLDLSGTPVSTEVLVALQQSGSLRTLVLDFVLGLKGLMR